MVLLVLALGAMASAATSRVDAVLLDDPKAIRVSGAVADEVWRDAPATDAFVQREPQEGGEPSQRTEFRVAYDAATLYIQVRAFDTEPDKILTYLTRRDEDSPCDWLYVMIDSYHDRRTAYKFGVNPSGVKRDSYWFNDNLSDQSWDAVWDVSVTRDARGWSAEFRIPFSQLRFNPADSTTFGFAVRRQIGRLNEAQHVAAPCAQRERIRLVVRRARWPLEDRRAEASRAAAVHRRRPDAESSRRQSAD